MIIAATIGSVLGALILYFVGRLLSVERLEKLVSGRLGKVLRLKPEDITKAEKWFLKRGYATIFFCRFIPLIRSLISIPGRNWWEDVLNHNEKGNTKVAKLVHDLDNYFLH